MQPFGQNPQFPFMYPGVYSPGQVGFNNNPEMSQLISMFSGPLLGAMAGPGQFLPHMMPTQQVVDQFAMRNYQNQTRAAAFGMVNDNTSNVANRFLGIRSAFTDAAPTQLNREQAASMAAMANNPITKMVLGTMVGPENLEAIMHGSRGDVSALQNQISRIGYFRDDPSGGGRMDAESLMSYTRGMYAEMYEPQGNLTEIEQESRATDIDRREAGRVRLKRAAKRESVNIVEDDDLVSRLEGMDNATERVDALYKKYVHGGTATDTKQQAQELVKFERAIQASGALKENEATISGLVKQAERVPVNEMRGFTAGQVGQLTENMFQRGLLPQAVGAMSAADRVKLISQTDLDDETKLRLSREMARRDFEDKNNASEEARQYRSLTSEPEREEFVRRRSGDYQTRLEETRNKIKETATGSAGAMSATELEKLQGFDSLASNVDAKRSTEAIKKYTGAVAAIRDIFGDNGNPNAPLPALLAALEGLTGGAVGSMKPQKIEATLRQMQTAAKEAGIGFEQMAAMSTQIDSVGQALNLTPADTLRLKGASMTAVKVMQDTGAFSNPVYGQVDKGTATGRAAELITRGAASRGNRAMAALEAIYQADPTRFQGQELEEALKAYRNNEGDGSYTDPKTGQKKNIRDLMGTYGVAGATGILEASGGNLSEFTAQINDPNVMQYANPVGGFLMQKSEQIRDITFGDTQGRVISKLQNRTNMFAGMDHQERAQMGATVGTVIARMTLDNAGMERADQITKIQQDLETELTKEFEKTMPAADAAAKAREAAGALTSRSDINEFIGGAGAVYAARTGGRQMSENAQLRAGGRDAQIAAEYARQNKRAERRSAVNMGFEGTPMGRMSDYLLDIGVNQEKFNVDEFVKAMSPFVADSEILRRYGGDMQGGFDALSEMRHEAFITNKDVDSAARDKNTAQIREFAGLDAKDDKGNYKTAIISDAEAATKRDAKIAEVAKDNNVLLQQYRQYVNGASSVEADKMTDKERDNMLKELRANDRFNADMTRKALGDSQYSETEAVKRARSNVGTVKRGQERLAEDTDKIQKAMLDGEDKDARREGVFAAFRALELNLTDEQESAIREAIDATGEGSDKKLTEALAVIGDDEKRGQAQKIFGGIQTGRALNVRETLGIDRIPDRELTRQVTAQFEAQGMSPAAAAAKAKEVQAGIEQQRAAEQKAGGPAATPAATSAAANAAKQKQLETALTDTYVKQGVDKTKAEEMAKADAAGIMSRAEEATRSADSVSQRVNTLEVNAQTVVIKSGRIEGGGTTGGSSSAPGAAQASDLPTTVADVNKEMDTLAQKMKPTSTLGKALGYGTAYFENKDDEARYRALSKRKQELAAAEGKQPETQAKKDESLDKSVPAPQAPAAEPEKVQQANDAQLKRDNGGHAAPTGTAADNKQPENQSASARKKERELQNVTQNGGDPLSTNSRAYVVDELELRKKKRNANNVAQQNDTELMKNSGATSANVSPEQVKAARQTETSAADVRGGTAAAAVPASETESPQQPPALNAPLSQSISEKAPPAGGGTSATSRVHALPAAMALGQTGGYHAPVSPAPSGAAGGSMTINGTLTLSGLQEAMISAQGSRVMQTDGGGAPVVIDPMLQQRAPAAPKTYG